MFQQQHVHASSKAHENVHHPKMTLFTFPFSCPILSLPSHPVPGEFSFELRSQWWCWGKWRLPLLYKLGHVMKTLGLKAPAVRTGSQSKKLCLLPMPMFLKPGRGASRKCQKVLREEKKKGKGSWSENFCHATHATVRTQGRRETQRFS